MRHRDKPSRVLVIMAALLLVAAACGDDDEAAPTTAAPTTAAPTTAAPTTAAPTTAAPTTAAPTTAAPTTAAPTTAAPTTTQAPTLIELAKDEPGDLKAFEWGGYEDPVLWQDYANAFPGSEPNFVFMGSSVEWLGKVRAGETGDISHACIDVMADAEALGILQPWDTSLLSNFSSLDPSLVEAGQIDGKQYYIPDEWGPSSVLYRTDEVEASDSYGLLFDDRYAGKISWFDNFEVLLVAGLVLGVPDVFNMTDPELAQVKDFLIEKKKNVRNFWTSRVDLETDFANGTIWISYTDPAFLFALQDKGLDVAFNTPREGRVQWVCGWMLFKDAKNYYHAHAYADAWISPDTQEYLANVFGYGIANTAISDRIDPAIREVLALDDPAVLANAHVMRNIPRRDGYQKIWSEVKAAS